MHGTMFSNKGTEQRPTLAIHEGLFFWSLHGPQLASILLHLDNARAYSGTMAAISFQNFQILHLYNSIYTPNLLNFLDSIYYFRLQR